jgi:hypothetical protein
MFNTPQPADPFARFMATLFDDREGMPAPGGFCAFFGHRPNGSEIIFSPDSDTVDIDIIRGNEKIAATIPRGLNGRTVSAQKNTQEGRFTNASRKYPLIEEEGDITASQLTKAMAGESRYGSGLTQYDRLRAYALKQHSEHMRRIARTFEYLASVSVIQGQQPAIIGTVNSDLIYDFKRNAENFITVGTAWSDIASDILGDIDNGCLKVRQNGRKTPDMILFSGPDMDAFMKNTAIKEQADNRGFEVIRVTRDNPVPERMMRFVDAGMIARGLLRTPEGFELWMFTYVDSFDDETGNAVKYLPDNKTVIAASEARCDLYLGPPERLPLSTAEKQWYQEMFGMNMDLPSVPMNMRGTKWSELFALAAHCDAYPRAGRKGVAIRSQAAPIFPTTQTDAFVTITTTP